MFSDMNIGSPSDYIDKLLTMVFMNEENVDFLII